MKQSATFRSHVLRGQFALPNPTGTGKDGMNHYCHLPFTRNMETRPPEMNSDWPAKRHHGGVFAVFSSFVGRIYFALATSSCWYCPNDSDVKAECLRTQAWLSHGVSCLWNHILACHFASVTSLVLAHFDMSRWAVVIIFCLCIFHMYITVDCAPVILWICCHCGYWGMVHWLCIWKSQAKNILNHYWYVVLFKKLSLMWW